MSWTNREKYRIIDESGQTTCHPDLIYAFVAQLDRAPLS